MDPLSGSAPVYIKPGSRPNPDRKDERTLYWHDRRNLGQEQRATESLGETKKETLKEQRLREEKERVEKVERLSASSADHTLFEDDINLVRISKYFGVPPENFGDFKGELSLLWEWGAKQSGSNDYVNILSALHKLEKNVDIGLEENRIKSLYRWIRLDLDQKRIEQEKSLYEKGEQYVNNPSR